MESTSAAIFAGSAAAAGYGFDHKTELLATAAIFIVSACVVPAETPY